MLLGRRVVVMGVSALVGRGVEGSETDVGGIASQTSEINTVTCPKLVPPGPGFCEPPVGGAR